jgi:hypothetical protein
VLPALEVPGEAVPTGSGLAADLQGNGLAVHQVDLGPFALLRLSTSETLLILSAP